MRRYIILLLALLVLPTVFATHALEADLNYGWTNHGYNEEGNGWVLPLGISSYFMNTSSISTTSVVHGNNCDPLVLDTGTDDKNDIVGSSGNYVNLYTTDLSGNLQLIDQYILNGVGCGSIAMVQNDTVPAYVFPAVQGLNSYIYVFTVNATKIKLLKRTNISKSYPYHLIRTNVQCTSITSPNSCYFGTYFSTNSALKLFKYVPETNMTSFIYQYLYQSGPPFYYIRQYDMDRQLVLADWDNDYTVEAGVIIKTYDSDTAIYYQGAVVVDTSDGTKVAEDFSSIYYGYYNYIRKIGFYNINGGSHLELVYDGQHNYCDTVVSYIDSSGSKTRSAVLDGVSSPYCSKTRLNLTSFGWAAGYFTKIAYQICLPHRYYVQANNTYKNVISCCDSNMSCFTSSTNNFVTPTVNWGSSYNVPYGFPVSGDYNSDGYTDMVLANSRGQIYSPRTKQIINTSDLGNIVELVDMNDDGVGEILGQKESLLKIVYTNYTVPAPTQCYLRERFSYADTILNHDWKGESIVPILKSGNYFLNFTTSLTDYIWREFSCGGSQINFSFSLRLDDYDEPDINGDPFSEYQFEVSLGHGTSNNINIIFSDFNITGAPDYGLVMVLNGSTLVNSSAITYAEGAWYNYSVVVDLLFDKYDFYQNGNKIWDDINMAAPLSVINNFSFGWLNYVSPATAYLDNVFVNISGVEEQYYNYIPYVSYTEINSSYLTEFQTLRTTMYFSDAEANTMYAAVDCDWQTGREGYTCLNTPYAQCSGAVSSPQSFNCVYNTTGTKTIKYYVNDNIHNGTGAQLSGWNYATRSIVVYENGSLPPSEAWDFNYVLVLNDYDSSNKLYGAVAEMFDVPTQGVNDYEVETTDSGGFAYFNFSNLAVKFCLNATISSYLWYKDCDVDVSLVEALPQVSNRYLKKLDSGSYETYWEYRVRDNCNLNGKPEWYGWYHGNSELTPSWTANSGYSYDYESALGYALALNNTAAKGFFHKTYTVNPESRFEFSVRMKPTTTAFADSNELFVNLWGSGHKQIVALRIYTQDVASQEKVFLQYWHPTEATWKTVWNNTAAQIPFTVKILTDVNSSRYSLELRDFGLFEEIASGITFITASSQPTFFELRPVYTSNPNKDIFVDSVWFLDRVSEEDLLPEGIEEDDVCNQFYYDTGLGRWKYDKNRCVACNPGESIFFCMFKNSFRWAIAKFAIWVLRNFLYFLLVLILIILLAPLIIRWRRQH